MGPDAEETVGFGQKRAQHEHAAHEVRNWVRLTFDCNDRCVFCLDADTHDGRIRGRAEVKAQIVAARIIVEGVVRGDLSATESIEIHAPARVYGNLSSPALEIQRGSVFEGSCQMDGSGHANTASNGQRRRETKPTSTTDAAPA